MNQRMKQRIEKLEDQQGPAESQVDCIILVAMNRDGSQKHNPITAYHRSGATVLRQAKESCGEFEQRACSELRRLDMPGPLLITASY